MRGIIATGSGQAPDDERPAALVIDAVDAAGQRVDRYLAARIDGVSRTRLQQWIALGAVQCNERALSASTRLKGGERIVVFRSYQDGACGLHIGRVLCLDGIVCSCKGDHLCVGRVSCPGAGAQV